MSNFPHNNNPAFNPLDPNPPSPNNPSTPTQPNRPLLTLTQAQQAWQRLLPGNASITHEEAPPTTTPQRRPATLSTNNLRDNHHWGDRLSAKHDNTLRIYVQNVAGISIDAKGGDFTDILTEMNLA